MDQSNASAPPPYRSDTPPTETTLAPTSSVQITAPSNIAGLREQILDNSLTLFHLAHGKEGKKNLPAGFRIITRRIFERNDNDCQVGDRTAALVVQDFKESVAVWPFVQGPEASDTESALRALLDKVETMIGKRWSSVPRINAPGVHRPNYLER